MRSDLAIETVPIHAEIPICLLGANYARQKCFARFGHEETGGIATEMAILDLIICGYVLLVFSIRGS